ncbi:MAG: RNA polymerase-associated protein RapA [Pseudidiomarina mangrovi]|nr:MAG: RNA polymerase-associated protein RapA [Pseudidiomarina mangrovi]
MAQAQINTDMDSEFQVGQRWLSETETDQGLGLITQVQGRLISVFFPATDALRQYARDAAPLARFTLLIDERAQHAEGWWFRITARSARNGCWVYQGEREDDQQTVSVAEAQLAANVATQQPLTRMLAGKIDRLDLFRLRQQAQQYLRRWQHSRMAGLLGARAQLLGHQLYIAASVADRFQPRVLLADEVGLGKTIEAGLIMQRRLLTGRSSRLLVVVPDSLCHQWLVELQRRFALRFSLFDQERCEQTALSSDAVFASEQLVLLPLSMLSKPFWFAELIDVPWDLLVVDEAHQIAPEQPHFSALQQLCEAIPALLLLSATPERAGSEAHLARLRLLDSDRFADAEAFAQEQHNYRALAPLAQALAQAQAPLLLDRLLDLHGTGRVMFRNSRAHIGGFPERQLRAVPLPASSDSFQSRADWLTTLLKQQRQHKFVVICREPEQVLQLSDHLRIGHGIHAAVFHQHMSLLERDRAAAYFASEEDGCQLLICSEIGSEGRNFQSAQNLVLFDLPPHPDLLEQRIGRLDRLGQTGAVIIHVPVVADSAEQIWFRWYDSMQAFSAPNPVGAQLYQQFAARLKTLIEQQTSADADTQLIATHVDALCEETRIAAQQFREEVAAGRDLLQELNAYRPHAAAAIIDTIRDFDDDPQLVSFMQAFWLAFGVDYDELNAHSGWLRPTEQLRVNLPGLPEDGLTVSFDRQYALAHDDVEFLSWDHPQVQHALELFSEHHFGCTAVALLKNRALPAGSWFLEVFFSSVAVAPAPAVAAEFYPRQTLRVLLDSQGRDLSTKVGSQGFDSQLQRVDKQTARGLLKQLRPQWQQLLKQAWGPAEQQQQQLAAGALKQLEGELDRAQQRMQQLLQRNPQAPAVELAALQQRRQQLLQGITQPLLQLDAVRLVVNLPT